MNTMWIKGFSREGSHLVTKHGLSLYSLGEV